MKIKRNTTDKIFSDYIRAKAGWKCQRCGSKPNKGGLHNAHCYGRRGRSTRWLELNCLSLCYGCHSYLDQNPLEKYEFWKSIIGKKNFEKLTKLKSVLAKDVDEKAIREEYREKLKKLNTM